MALLLDYDGTLSPIAKHPDLAVLPPETKKVLERLANRSDVFIAIVSGRSVDNVKKMVGIEGNFLIEFLLPSTLHTNKSIGKNEKYSKMK